MTKLKVAIYARYSSDLQSDASIEDQIRLCEKRAESEGWQVVQSYTDHGLSGASMMRPGIQMLMQDAALGKFTVVIAEALDRISRDQEDIAGIYKRVSFAGGKIYTLAEGEVSDIHIGLKGTMNALFLKDLAAKTHRGLSGRVEKGKSGGGIAYGYDVVKKFTGDGEPIRGDREINEEQAEVVRRIFQDYARGLSPKKIALQLNEEGIEGPSGKPWGPSTIYGNRRRGTGIINNELYIGQLIWNRQKFIKDPDTGKRIARLNPKEEWQITDVPHLRIVDQALWDSVKGRQKALDDKPQFWAKQRPRNLFSYLLKCDCCGGGMSKVSSDRIGCSTARNKGSCHNRLTIKQEDLENTILDALKHYLMDKKLLKVFCEEYTNHINALRSQRNATIHRLEKELEKLAEGKQKIIEAIKNGIPASEVKDELDQIVERRTEIESILETTEEAPVLLHPNMASRYQKEVNALTAALNREETRAEAADLLRSLIDKIVLKPKENGKEYAIDLHGDLAGILTIASGKHKKVGTNDPIMQQVKMMTDYDGSHQNGEQEKLDESSSEITTPSQGGQMARLRQDKVVAGAGFEPTTFGL